jgi:Flp pilus assembly protein TadG
MVEMVIITPLLLLLVLAVSELGKAFVQYNTLTKYVRAAARQVSGIALLGTTGTVVITADMETAAKNLVVYGNVTGAGTPQLPALATDHISVTDAGNDMILVQANYPNQPLTGPFLESFGLGDEPSMGITLTASVTMRAL